MLSKQFFIFSCLICVSLANPLNFDSAGEDDEAAGRVFLTSNGGFSLTNTTVNLQSILAAALLALLFALTLGPSAFGGFLPNNNSGYGYKRQGYQAPPFPHHQHGHKDFHARSDQKAWDRDLASQMFELAQAFKKYDVTDVSCQKYVACESSQENRLEENGAFAKMVNNIMRNMDQRHGFRAVHAKDVYVAELLTEFKRGRTAFKNGVSDACELVRRQCYDKEPVNNQGY